MKSRTHGDTTLALEVVHISQHGIWLLVGDREYFLDYVNYPWFKEATVAQILEVQWEGGTIIRWPQLDVDLSERILENLEGYPLVSKG